MSVRDWLPQVIFVMFLLIGNMGILRNSDDKTFITTISGNVLLLGLLGGVDFLVGNIY